MNISFAGAVENPRMIGFSPELYLSDIFKNVFQLKENAYMYFAIIERRTINNIKQFLSFSPYEILQNKNDIELKQGDKILFYSNIEIQNLIKVLCQKNSDLTPESNQILEESKGAVGSIKELVKRYTIVIEGSVINPGKYVISGKTSLKNIINVAGGLSKSADLSRVRISRPEMKSTGDVVLVYDEVFLVI